MSDADRAQEAPPRGEFERQARLPQTGLLQEYWAFLREERKWWLLPLLAALSVSGGFVFLSGTAAAPFIFALF